MQTRINRQKYTFSVIQSICAPKKFKKCPHPLLRPRTDHDHACPQKPNPSRETVPLKTSNKVFCEEKVRLGILIKKF